MDPTDLLFDAKQRGLVDRLTRSLSRGDAEEVHAILLDIQALAFEGVLVSIRLVDGQGVLVDHVGKVVSLQSAAFVIEGDEQDCLLVAMVSGRPQSPRSLRFAWAGLEGSGKSSFLHRVKYGEFQDFKATIGIDVVTIDFEGHDFENAEVSGNPGTRKQFFSRLARDFHPDGVVFTVDASRPECIVETMEFLEATACVHEITAIPVLFMATKQDVPGAFSPAEIAAGLELEKVMAGRPWRIIGTSARTGTGVDEFLYHVARVILDASRLDGDR